MPTDLATHEVLDARQLSRIAATHRGFLYQDLFAAECLLKGSSDIEMVVVEHDEDLELATGGRHIYVQVKTRSGPFMKWNWKDSSPAPETLRQLMPTALGRGHWSSGS